jgi:hypothetical protein
MADRDYDKLTMPCPKCGTSGVAEASTSDSMYAKIEGFYYTKTERFNVDSFPPGFSLAKDGGGYQRKTEVRHSCGTVFKL